jgi:cytosine/adenosine deaminase-related metal-dependent hydrolase
MPPAIKTLPVEVELALQVMPCQAMRRSYDAGSQPHACSHFAEWGTFHSFDYSDSGPPPQSGIVQASVYAGKRPVTPEILSGCRKAPILAVGINPNLPGWSESTRNAIHPYFEDYLQYAHYFRWRATSKLRIPRARYLALKGSRNDEPYDNQLLMAKGLPIDVELSPVTMYEGYQSLLDGLAERMGWTGHKLAVGEDIAYANMVACGSARWTTRPVEDMPVMGQDRARAIVKECFHDRLYFVKQMLQTLPGVVMVFSQTTTDAFIRSMDGKFNKGNPQPQEPISELIKREIRLKLGQAPDGTVLDARVIFSPHVSARPDDFDAQRDAIIGHLAAEAVAGGLQLNAATGHLARKRGGCLFCENALYSIGPCDYRAELQPLADPSGLSVLSDDQTDSGAAVLAERQAHLNLVDAFAGRSVTPARSQFEVLDAAAPSAPPLVLLGDVVTMDGEPIRNGAVYLRAGEIISVQRANAPKPPGFETARVVETGGAIYPGLADLHNHLVYNGLSLWWPRQARANRSQWLRDPEYKRLVSMPMDVVAGRQDLLRALIRYVEVKLLLGGVTSGQGMVSKYRGGANFRGLIRNFEQSDDKALPSIRHKITDLNAGGIDDFKDVLQSGSKYFFHLAEGTNTSARNQFVMLKDNNLIAKNLVGIHSLGLEVTDLEVLAAEGAAVVWSPFSNSILYGRTIQPRDLLSSGVRFSLGSDWTPSGSRNILQEMKIAALTAEAANVPLAAKALVEAVTVNAFDIAGWGNRLGKLRPHYYADLLVLDKRNEDLYDNLLAATEREVALVIVAGHPRYGDRMLMTQTGVGPAQLEAITVGGRDKALNLRHPASPLNHVTFKAAKEALERAFADLPAARDAAVFEPLDDADAIEVELDMQALDAEEPGFDVLAEVELPQSIPLDPPTVIDDLSYWTKLDSIGHMPKFLKGTGGLRRYYR